MIAEFGTHALLCFRPIEQDISTQKNNLIVDSGFNRLRKNLSLLYFC